jgi:hypothetical protein
VRRLSCLLLFFASFPASALTLRPLNIDQLTDKARRIVVGTVVSVDEQKGAIVAKLRVQETYKGDSAKEVSIRQFALMGPGKKLRTPYGLPTFRKGERVLVFLPNAGDSGFQSPVGLGQGVFHLVSEKADSPALNEYQNRTLFHGTLSTKTNGTIKRLSIKSSTGKPSSVTLSQLKELIRERTTNAK